MPILPSKMTSQAQASQETSPAAETNGAETRTPRGKPGSVPQETTLYAKFDKNGNRSWSKKTPEELEEAAENSDTKEFALIVRKMVPKEADSYKPLVIDSIVVQSPNLKRILSEVLEDYPGIETNVTRLVLSAPFECFVHRWDHFVRAKENPAHEEDKAHLELLFDILSEELRDVLEHREDAYRNKTVKWQYVWTVFPPGSTILTTIGGAPAAVRVDSGSYVETQCGPEYRMNCDHVDWDGKQMGWAKARQRIPYYEGSIPFTDLPCYPLEYNPQADLIKTSLVARGRVFESLAGTKYKYCEGSAMYWPEVRISSQNERQWESVSSRIVLDGEGWKKFNSNYAKPLESFGKKNKASKSVTFTARNLRDDPRENDTKTALSASRAPLTEDQLLLASPIVRGYCLNGKKWMEFIVTDISDIVFDKNAFDSLVLDESRKELILAFAESHAQHNASFDDVITGKGRGVIMMLSGTPGTGKTLTAESVAEKMQVPLYILSSSDLGTSSQKVEQVLNDILGMVAKWNAVLLLDECDIFLEERTTHDLERNKVVGTFLRMLEYYKGLLFLTTNRAASIDPAFHSRIHLSLEYNDLDAAARKVIWAAFVNKLASRSEAEPVKQADSVTEEQFGRLSSINLNGRQIKNIVKMANLLASRKKQTVNFDHIELVLKAEGYTI